MPRLLPMPAARASSRLLPRLTIALLLLAAAVTAVLGYEAWDAARAQRHAAEGTLRDYADFAAWELVDRAKVNAVGSVFAAFAPVMAQRVDVTALPPAALEAAVRAQEPRCFCTSGLQFAFSVPLDAAPDAPHAGTRGAARVTGAPLATPAVRAWLADTVRAFARREPPAAPAPLIVRPPRQPGDSQRVVSVPVTSVTHALLYPRLPDAVAATVDSAHRMRDLALALVVLRGEGGRPVHVIGFASTVPPIADLMFGRVLREERLLPPSLTRGIATDALLDVRVVTTDGRVVFRSDPRRADAPTDFSASQPLPPRFGGMAARVALRPAAAERLVIGGLPQSRLPALLGLSLLSAGLAGVVVAQMRRQQALVRLRADFVSGVSHELRTPLAQIRLLAELLALDKLPSAESRHRSARIIDQEARRLSFLVENVLSYSRAERRATRVAPRRVDLARELADVVAAFAPLADAQGATVRVVAGPGAAALVDPAALRQIVINLLDNAIRYGPTGQRVTVEVRAARGPGGGGPDEVVLAVEDQGPGIPPGERARVWEPYYRLERDARNVSTGSGIGLAVVADLVEQHGGRAWIEDGAFGGARVAVAFPAARAEAAAAPAPGAARAHADRSRHVHEV